MAKVLIKLPRKRYIEELDKEIMLGAFEKHVLRKIDKQFSDKAHSFSPEVLQQGPSKFAMGKDEYLLFEADFVDEYKLLKRLAQIITLKDIGRIITLLGITRDSVVVESGAGSGAATCYLAKIAKAVHTYEIEDEHLHVAQENVKNLSLDNVTFYKGDIYEDVGAHEADAFLLDVPDPQKALPQLIKALRIGGRAVIYTPNLTQAQDAVNNLPDELLYEGTIELTERQWQIKGKVMRPRIQGLGHTAFLTTVRKVPSNNS